MGARDLLAELRAEGFSLTADRGRLAVRPASRLTPELRALVSQCVSELVSLVSEAELAAVAWTDADLARFLARRDRLMRWGWVEPEAEAVAERLVLRDREADPRVACAECQHYRPGKCSNHRYAGLLSAEVGRDLAGLLQRCAGFKERG
jgi:hypothetical protein